MVVYQKNNLKHSSLPDEEFMNPEQIEYFRSKLIAWKESILKESKETILYLNCDCILINVINHVSKVYLVPL